MRPVCLGGCGPGYWDPYLRGCTKCIEAANAPKPSKPARRAFARSVRVAMYFKAAAFLTLRNGALVWMALRAGGRLVRDAQGRYATFNTQREALKAREKPIWFTVPK